MEAAAERVDSRNGERPDVKSIRLEQNGPDVIKVENKKLKHRDMHTLGEVEITKEKSFPRMEEFDLGSATVDIRSPTRAKMEAAETKEPAEQNQRKMEWCA